jgi:hypothetical protein
MANRRGISGAAENPDLEARLLSIESALASINSDPQEADTDSATERVDLTEAPGVYAFSLQARVPGGFTVSWGKLSQEELTRVSRYEVIVATNLNFTDKQSYFADKFDTSFLYADGDPASSFYVRMRALGISSRPGPFSPTLETSTGKLLVSHIVPDARYSYVELVERPLTPVKLEVLWSYSPTLGRDVPHNDERIFANKIIELRKSKAFLISLTVDVKNVSFGGFGSAVSAELLLDGQPHATFIWQLGSQTLLEVASDTKRVTTFSFMGAVEPATPRVYNMSLRLKALSKVLAPSFLPVQFPTTTVNEGGDPSFEVVSFTFRLIQLLE